MAVRNALDAPLDFGFSAGPIDLLLNATKDNTTGLGAILLPGVFYFFRYFGVFYLLITEFNMPTPGREADPEEPEEEKTVRAKTDEDPGSGDSSKDGSSSSG